MTLQEAKDQIAYKMKLTWEEVQKHHSVKGMETTMSEVAELYARSKWDEACIQQRHNCYRAYMDQPVVEANRKHEMILNEMGAIQTALKPEFKP